MNDNRGGANEPELLSLLPHSYDGSAVLQPRSIAKATARQRLRKRPKLVSEPRLSLSDRPSAPEGRFKNNAFSACCDFLPSVLFEVATAGIIRDESGERS